MISDVDAGLFTVARFVDVPAAALSTQQIKEEEHSQKTREEVRALVKNIAGRCEDGAVLVGHWIAKIVLDRDGRVMEVGKPRRR